MAIEAVFGALVALVVAMVGGTWRLSTRLGKVEARLGILQAEDKGTERRLDGLESGQEAAAVLRDRVTSIEAVCAARHKGS